jgi:hypothetical protein
MRLLSIFALLFLISILLYGRLENRLAPDERTSQDTTEATDAEPEQAEQEDFSSLNFSPPYPARHFDFEQEAAFNARTVEIEIKNLIVNRHNDNFKMENRLCVVGYEFPRSQQGKKRTPAKKEVVVYWKEGKMLYRWKGGDPRAAEQDFYNARSLTDSLSYPLDPNQGVLGEEADGSRLDDYKARLENTITDCEKHGKHYEIEPFVPPPRGFKRPEGGGRSRPQPPVAPSPAVPPSDTLPPDALPLDAPPPDVPPSDTPTPAAPPSPGTPPILPSSSPFVRISSGRPTWELPMAAGHHSNRSSARAAMNKPMLAVIAMLEP